MLCSVGDESLQHYHHEYLGPRNIFDFLEWIRCQKNEWIGPVDATPAGIGTESNKYTHHTNFMTSLRVRVRVRVVLDQIAFLPLLFSSIARYSSNLRLQCTNHRLQSQAEEMNHLIHRLYLYYSSRTTTTF